MPINMIDFIGKTGSNSADYATQKTHWRQVIDGENYAYKKVKEYFDNMCGENSAASVAAQVVVDIPICICADLAEVSAITRDILADPNGTISKIQKHEQEQFSAGIKLIKNLPNKISNFFKQDK